MNKYFGIIRFSMPFCFKKEVLGKTFTTQIAGKEISLRFPLISPNYDPDTSTPPNGDLYFPNLAFSAKINWGMVLEWPSGLFSIEHLFCTFSAKDNSEIEMIYTDFPRWKERLLKLHLVSTANFISPEIKYAPVNEENRCRCDDLTIYKISNERTIHHINNSIPYFFDLHWVQEGETYSIDKTKQLFADAGSLKEITLAYELLITAYHAFERYDFISAVILGGSAVEQAILKRTKQEYAIQDNYKRAKKKHKMLTKRFNWLAELNVTIPIKNYKDTIIDIRNKATHEGIRPTRDDTKICLENCKTIIEYLTPQILEP